MSRKPISVWIAQILIGLAWVLFTGAFVYYAALTWAVIVKAIAPYPQALMLFAARTLLTVTLIVLVGWTIVLISRRSPWGRWLGVLCLVGLLGVAVYSTFNPSANSWQPSNDAQRGGYFVGQIIGLVLYMVLIWRFGFARPARAFFARTQPA